MANINFEYAINLEENERKWEERRAKLNDIIMFFCKNTLLQFLAMDINFRAMDLSSFIDKGERGEFLASEIDSFLSDFEQTKKAYEQSGMADEMAQLAEKITNQTTRDCFSDDE